MPAAARFVTKLGSASKGVLQYLAASTAAALLVQDMLVLTALAHANKHHYGDPKGGCLADERNITVQGLPGDLCSPLCAPSAKVPCPLDVPEGVTAQPRCDITYEDQGKGCCLTCAPTSDKTALRAGDAQCGAGSCQPIQGLGVCTYGAPPPSGLPSGCVAAADKRIACAGNVSPEPGCEQINNLCCANTMPDAFARLAQYQSHHPFDSLIFKCNGNFGGADASWASLFGSLMRNITGLHTLALDLSFNERGSDSLIPALEAALVANPHLTNVTIALEGSNISDVGASQLGEVLHTHVGDTATALSVNVRRNDPGTQPTRTPLTAIGAGKMATSIGRMSHLSSLDLKFGYCTSLTAAGVVSVAIGLWPLQPTLRSLQLDFGYVALGADSAEPFACLGRLLGGFHQLHTLVLDLDADLDGPGDEAVRALGLHVSCLPVVKMVLPGFEGYDNTTDCHCGLAVDQQRMCLTANKNYPNLGPACFECLPQANSTSCQAAPPPPPSADMILPLISIALAQTQPSCVSDVDCNMAGRCAAGACKCDIGWAGTQCETVKFGDSYACGDGGLCLHGEQEFTSTWGGEAVHADDGKWHIYAAGFANNTSLSSWLTLSRVLHGVSETPVGPFKLADVALGPREGWDGKTQHNPACVRAADGTFLLFYMGAQQQDVVQRDGLLPDVGTGYTCPMGSGQTADETVCMQRVGLATASSPNGPWQRRDAPVLSTGPSGEWDDLFTTNPTPHAFANGSVLLIYKARSRSTPGVMSTGVAFADHWAGPYRRLSSSPLDMPSDCEDAGIYYSNAMSVFRMLLHCGCSYQSIWSVDGRSWSRTAPPQPWCNVSFAPGAPAPGWELLRRRERPKWVVNADGQPTHLITGVMPSSEHQGQTFTMVTAIRP